MFGDMLQRPNISPDLLLPYAKSTWVRAAIAFVSAPISMRPLVFTADQRGGDVRIDNPDLTKFWEKPGRNFGGVMNRSEFIEASVGWLKLRGQCFWIMDDTWLDPRFAVKSRLFLARPQDMSAIMHGRELIGWSWINSNGIRSSLIPEQVAHVKFWNPYHEIMGLSEWEAAMVSAESDYAAGIFSRNLSMNNGDQGPYVIGKDSSQFSDDQIKQVSAQLRMKRELGRRGDFRAAFIPANVEIKEPSLAAVDRYFVAQRLENRKEVYAAFGVPMSFADPQASYSIGSASDRFRLIEDTCMPVGAKLEDAIEMVSQRLVGTGQTLFCELDWDSHSTMQQVRSERFLAATSAVDRGMPWHEASEYFRLKLPRFPGDDVGRIPFNLTEITGTPEPEAEEPSGSDGENDPLSELETMFAAKPQHRCTQCSGKAPAGTKANEHYLKIRKYRQPWEKKFAGKVSRYLMDARAETLRNIAKAGNKSLVCKVDASSLMFNLTDFLQSFTKGLGQVSRSAMESAGIEVWTDELHRDEPLTMPSGDVLTAIQNRENKLTDAGHKIFQEVQGQLQAGINAGDTMEQLADRTRSAFAGIDKARSMVIAKTETTVAYETARNMAFRAAGVQWKQWLTSGLGNSRPSHEAANEQIVEVDEPFNVGGEDLMFPGDPSGSAGEVINCNCVSIAVDGPDGGKTLGKPKDISIY